VKPEAVATAMRDEAEQSDSNTEQPRAAQKFLTRVTTAYDSDNVYSYLRYLGNYI
jgi:hypothetical protein